jgi:hypothetical protein
MNSENNLSIIFINGDYANKSKDKINYDLGLSIQLLNVVTDFIPCNKILNR